MILAPLAVTDVLLQFMVESHFRSKEALIGTTAERWQHCNIQYAPPSVGRYAVKLRMNRSVGQLPGHLRSFFFIQMEFSCPVADGSSTRSSSVSFRSPYLNLPILYSSSSTKPILALSPRQQTCRGISRCIQLASTPHKMHLVRAP